MPASPEWVICVADQLATRAADRIVTAAGDAIRARGRFVLALAGGSTPEKTYTLLSSPQYATKLDWSRVFLFFSDERFVPRDDPRSNYHLAQRTLTSRVPIDDDHVFAIPTDTTPAESAARYAQTLATFFGVPIEGPPPAFDLILLGLGDDGHTASLFPDKPALNETKAWVVASPPGVLPPPVDRVTFTYPLLNAARAVLFLVAGANKSGVVKQVLTGAVTPQQAPAAGVQPAGVLTWMMDEAAAAQLSHAER